MGLQKDKHKTGDRPERRRAGKVIPRAHEQPPLIDRLIFYLLFDKVKLLLLLLFLLLLLLFFHGLPSRRKCPPSIPAPLAARSASAANARGDLQSFPLPVPVCAIRKAAPSAKPRHPYSRADALSDALLPPSFPRRRPLSLPASLLLITLYVFPLIVARFLFLGYTLRYE